MIRGNELAAVLLWHYGVRWRTPTDGLPGPESGALARISPDDESAGRGFMCHAQTGSWPAPVRDRNVQFDHLGISGGRIRASNRGVAFHP